MPRDILGVPGHTSSMVSMTTAGACSAATPFAEVFSRLAAPTDESTSDSLSVDIQYDFRNMTPRELQETVNGLIRDGQLSLNETAPLLVFMWPPSVALNPAGDVDGLLDKPRDFLAELATGIEWAIARNEPDSAASRQMALAALQRFQFAAA